MRHEKTNGFSIIELLIVLIIIGILTAMLTPAYRSYVLKSNRGDAIKSLMALQIAQEKYRVNNTAYGTLANVWTGSSSIEGYYTMTVPSNTSTSYTLTATAAGTQTSDTSCTSFTLTYATNTMTQSSASNTNCWSQ